MRPIDFDAYLEAQKTIERKQMQLLAWHAANIMNGTGNFKPPLQIEDLIGEEEATEKPKKTKKSKVRNDAALKELFTRIDK